jgi:hypothetical protein
MTTEYDTALAAAEAEAHRLRCQRNKALGLPMPPTLADFVSDMEALLADQNDCAQYLEPDTRAVSIGIYNSSHLGIRRLLGQPADKLWDGDESAAHGLVVKAAYTSEWDGDTTITTACRFDMDTKTCFDIETSNAVVSGGLSDEYVTLPSGVELRTSDGVTFGY